MCDLSASDSDSYRCTCEFWIYNFRYEIFYDLKKRCYVKQFLDELEASDNMDACKEQGNPIALISSLPTEMLSRVFSFLTAIDLLVIRDVCQKWRAIVQEDKSLWNYAHFSSSDLDVKTTVSLLQEMPLLRRVELCNVHSVDDMSSLITALCHACWDLRQVHFPDTCDVHPSATDLHQLGYFHPCIASLHISTKQKLTGVEIGNIGTVLQDFSCLQDLRLVGFYWQQSELITDLLAKIHHIRYLSLPSLPGLNGFQVISLAMQQPHLLCLTLNSSSLTVDANKISSMFKRFINLSALRLIDSSTLNSNKLAIFNSVEALSYLDLNLNKSLKADIISFFKKPHVHLSYLKVFNCEYSDELLSCLWQSCGNIRTLIWGNPKDGAGEVTDAGVLSITKLTLLQVLEIKSRSISKAYYTNLASMSNLRYVRINGMRVSGCL